MARLIMRGRCNHKHRHDMSKQIQRYTEEFFETDALDEASLRKRLVAFVERLAQKARCDQVSGWINAQEDIPELKLRQSSPLLDEGVYLPPMAVCNNCGWRSGSGTSTLDVFFCKNPACERAMSQYFADLRATQVEAQKEAGRCIYNDHVRFPATDGYCTNPANGDDHLCAEHRAIKCDICGKQAVYTHWEFGSFAYEHFRCEDH